METRTSCKSVVIISYKLYFSMRIGLFFRSKTELCWASLAAARELLNSWEANVLTDTDAEKLFSKLSESSVVSSVCVYAWLVAKIKVSVKPA